MLRNMWRRWQPHERCDERTYSVSAGSASIVRDTYIVRGDRILYCEPIPRMSAKQGTLASRHGRRSSLQQDPARWKVGEANGESHHDLGLVGVGLVEHDASRCLLKFRDTVLGVKYTIQTPARPPDTQPTHNIRLVSDNHDPRHSYLLLQHFLVLVRNLPNFCAIFLTRPFTGLEGEMQNVLLASRNAAVRYPA